jgi:hypothetical protein
MFTAYVVVTVVAAAMNTYAAYVDAAVLFLLLPTVSLALLLAAS